MCPVARAQTFGRLDPLVNMKRALVAPQPLVEGSLIDLGDLPPVITPRPRLVLFQFPPRVFICLQRFPIHSRKVVGVPQIVQRPDFGFEIADAPTEHESLAETLLRIRIKAEFALCNCPIVERIGLTLSISQPAIGLVSMLCEFDGMFVISVGLCNRAQPIESMA